MMIQKLMKRGLVRFPVYWAKRILGGGWETEVWTGPYYATQFDDRAAAEEQLRALMSKHPEARMRVVERNEVDRGRTRAHRGTWAKM